MQLRKSLTRAALALLAGMALQFSPAYAQSDIALLGTWHPKVNDGGLAELILSDSGGVLQAHGFGACSPTFCDWGTVSGLVYGSNVSDPNGRSFTATFDFGFATTLLTGTLNKTGRGMTIGEYTVFTDGSPRDNFVQTNTFVR
jgi:hypothetical protein